MKKKEERHTWTTSTANSLYNELQSLADRTHVPKTRLLDEAIEDLLKKYSEKRGNSQQ